MKTLKDFLNDVLHCVENNETKEWFYSGYGLCANFYDWCKYYNVDSATETQMDEMMHETFLNEFGHYNYTFGGADLYYKQIHKDIMYAKDGARMKWIRDFVSR